MNSHKELAFEVAYAQLRSQKEDLRNARNQAGMAAAMTGLIGTVFASIVDPNNIVAVEPYSFLSVSFEFWFVILSFSSSIYFSAMVSMAQRTCNFELNPNWILEREGEAVIESKALLAKDCDAYFDQNELVIREARNNLWWAITMGCVQIPAWLLVLV